MLAFAALAAVLPVFVAAQGASSVPACALTCTISLASSSSCGGLTDISCLCTNAEFQASVLQCYTNTCSAEDLQAAIAYGAQTCQSVGVTLDTTAVPAGATGSAASTGAAVASSIVSSNAAQASSVASSISAGASSASSSLAAPAPTSTTGGAASALVRGNALVAVVVGAAGLAALL